MQHLEADSCELQTKQIVSSVYCTDVSKYRDRKGFMQLGNGCNCRLFFVPPSVYGDRFCKHASVSWHQQNSSSSPNELGLLLENGVIRIWTI